MTESSDRVECLFNSASVGNGRPFLGVRITQFVQYGQENLGLHSLMPSKICQKIKILYWGELREKIEELSQKDKDWVLWASLCYTDRQTLWHLELLTEPKSELFSTSTGEGRSCNMPIFIKLAPLFRVCKKTLQSLRSDFIRKLD